MGDDLILLALFFFLYVSDSYFLLHKHSIAFREVGKGHCRVIFPSSNAGNRDRALHMFSLIPPLRPTYISNLFPVSLSEKGILSYVSQSFATSGRPRQLFQAIKFNEIHSVRTEGTKILINSDHFVNCQVSEHARLISLAVDKFVNAKEKETSLIFQEIIDSVFDVNHVKQVITEYKHKCIPLQLFCNTIFVVLFVLFPVLARWQGLIFSLVFSLVILGVLLPPLCVSFYLLHKRYSIGDKWDRIGSIVRFIICPPCSIRANDVISRVLLSKFQPSSVSLALCRKTDALDFLRIILRDLQNPLRPDVNAGLALSIDEEWRKKIIAAIERTALQSGIEYRELLDVPIKLDPTIFAFCPRCLAQFSAPIDSCPDCLDVAPILFQTLGDKNV